VRRRALVAGLALLLLGLAPVAAGAVSQRVKNACEKDYLKFCPSYEVDTPQLTNCMAQAGKRRALSPRCFDALIDAGHIPRKYLTRK
jgi:hypothetical protein